jgi:antitoxin MazE
MKTELVRIGNSRGIRIPKPLIEQCGFGKEVELRIENERLVISPKRSARGDWEERFRAAGPSDQDERLLQTAGGNQFDREEWEW